MLKRAFIFLGSAVVAEIIPIAVLFIVVAIAQPGSVDAASEFATRAGAWVGPIVGALATFLIAYLLTKNHKENTIRAGALFGVLVALLDALILGADARQFQLLFLISGIGRVIAGAAGGFLAGRRSVNVNGRSNHQ